MSSNSNSDLSNSREDPNQDVKSEEPKEVFKNTITKENLTDDSDSDESQIESTKEIGNMTTIKKITTSHTVTTEVESEDKKEHMEQTNEEKPKEEKKESGDEENEESGDEEQEKTKEDEPQETSKVEEDEPRDLENVEESQSENEEEQEKEVAETSKPKVEFEHPKINEFNDLLDDFGQKFSTPFSKHPPKNLEYLMKEASFFCKNHLKQKKNLYLCLNVDCPLVVFCKICKLRKHSKCCSRVNMDIKLDEVNDKEELLGFFDVENFEYNKFESDVSEKFKNLKQTMNNSIDQMESLILKKVRLESKEFRLKSIYQKFLEHSEDTSGRMCCIRLIERQEEYCGIDV
jgi:hypothetical protein